MSTIKEKQTPQYQRQLMQQTYEDAKIKGTFAQNIDEYGLKQIEVLLQETTEPTIDSLLMKGIDMNVLGIDFSSTQHICGSFTTPFPSLKENIPNYYHIDSKELHSPHERINSFKNDLIWFYMFYCMVGNENQLKAAEQLMSKGWKYSNKYQKWVTFDGNNWSEFDVSKWTVQTALAFNSQQADFMSLKC